MIRVSNQLRQAVLHVCRLSAAKRGNPNYESYSEKVRRDFISSGLVIGGIGFFVLAILWLSAKVGWSYDVHWGRLLSCCGALLAGWATWFALYDASRSWSGSRPDEQAREGIFVFLMVPGIVLSAIGAAWWP